jgi:pimeloyl-ACP methyl ester carboxylesterase
MHTSNLVIIAAALAVPGCTSIAKTSALTDISQMTEVADAPDPAVTYANANRAGDIPYTEGYFGTGDNRLHYVEAGSGPLIILYHGFPSFWYSWFDQMEVLKADYRVVAVDGLGSGLSAKPLNLEPYDIANLAAQLDAFSRHLGGDDKYILIGHDWGSVLALSYAQAYPDRLHKVVGMNAPPLNLMLDYAATDPEQQRRSAYMQRFKVTTLEMLEAGNVAERVAVDSYKALGERGDLDPAELALFNQALASNTTLYAAMNWYRANVPPFDEATDDDKWPGPDARISVPGLFVWGDRDEVFVPALIAQIEIDEPMVKVVTLPGVNHWTPMENSAPATAAIVDFLNTPSS